MGFVAWAAIDRPRVVVELADGRAHLRRGRLPGQVLEDLEVVARLTGARGRVALHGRRPDLEVRTDGLDEGTAQRVRNVVRNAARL